MRPVIWFREVSKDDLGSIGPKALQLAELANAGFPIPNAFIITSEVFESILAPILPEIYRLLDSIPNDALESIQPIAKKVQDMILAREVPDNIRYAIIEAYDVLNVNVEAFQNMSREAMAILRSGRDMPYVAVRVSGREAQETLLNVKGNSNLLKSMMKAWASLFSSSAIQVRMQKKHSHEVSCAIIVQKQIFSQKSGIISTKNVVDDGEMCIDVGFGLSDAVLSGSIVPDQYIIEKHSLSLKQKSVQKQEWLLTLDPNLGSTVRRNIPELKRHEQKLAEYEMKRLAEIAKKVEKFYGAPQDIEFAIEGMNVFIIQSRPWSSLKKVELEIKKEFSSEPLVKGTPVSSGVVSGKVKILRLPGDVATFSSGEVMVVSVMLPEFFSVVSRAGAVVLDTGGANSEVAILCREYNIPCVTGAMHASKMLSDSQKVMVDGFSGKVHMLGELKKEEEVIETITDIRLWCSEHVPELSSVHAGVGLLDLSLLCASASDDPLYEEYSKKVQELVSSVAQSCKAVPVWSSLSDASQLSFAEHNPLLGWHGVRRSLDDLELLRAEIKAIVAAHDQGLTNVGVLLPFVSRLEEIRKVKAVIMELGIDPGEHMDFGIMVETPAAVQLMREICAERLDMVVLNTERLAALTMGADPQNDRVKHLIDVGHQAVVRQVKQVIEICKQFGVETCALARDELMVEWLVKVGVDSVIVPPDMLGKARQAVAKVEKKLLLRAARRELV